MFRQFDPPPVLLGNPPSVMIINDVRVWSRMTNKSLIGMIALLISETGKLMILAISYHVASMLSLSSMSNLQLYGPSVFQTSFSKGTEILLFRKAYE
jgi:hypothetical protein